MKQGSPLSARCFSCAFLDPGGKIYQIFVPIHALTDKSSSHDSNLQAKLKATLEQEDVDSEELMQLVKSAKASMSKLLMMRDILRLESQVSVEDAKKVLQFLLAQMESSNFAKKHLGIMSRTLALYDFLFTNTSQPVTNEFEVDVKTIEDNYSCSHFDAMNFVEVLTKVGYEKRNPTDDFTRQVQVK